MSEALKIALQRVQDDINEIVAAGHSVGTLSDGSHTFNEVYAARNACFMNICREKDDDAILNPIWKSQKYSDGKPVETGWFILGIYRKIGEQVSFHLPMAEWDKCKWAKHYDSAPNYDGHTLEDVIKRLATL